MVKKGSNFIPLVLDTRLLMAINGKASQKQQLNATYIMKLLVEHCKNDLTKDAYSELKKRYDKTVYEQREEKLAKKRAKLEREKKKIALKERELRLKQENAKTYAKGINLGIQNRKDKEIEDLWEELNDLTLWIKQQKLYLNDRELVSCYNKEKHEEYEKQLEQVKARLKELGEDVE